MDQRIEATAVGIAVNNRQELVFVELHQFLHCFPKGVQKTSSHVAIDDRLLLTLGHWRAPTTHGLSSFRRARAILSPLFLDSRIYRVSGLRWRPRTGVEGVSLA